MHIECNISKSGLKYLFGEQDTMEVCKDMEEANVKQHLWLHWDLNGMNYVKPPAPCVRQLLSLYFRFYKVIMLESTNATGEGKMRVYF